MPSRAALAGACLLVAGACLPALAEDTAPAAAEPLQTRLEAVQALCQPDGPIRLRFTLVNRSDEPVDVPLDTPLSATDGVALPLSLAFGVGERRALSLAYNEESPQELPALPLPISPPDAPRTLRLAAHGAVGAEIDLRPYHPAVRYAGSYRAEWRPLEGRLGVVTAEFRVEPRKDVILVTDLGKVTFVLDYEHAPRNVESFLDLVRQGFYDGKTLHRVIPGFIIQGGCPKGDGTGIRPDGKLLPAEFHNLPFDAGTLAMAHKPRDPNSASCQFFIGLARRPELDGQYTVIGQASDAESLRTLQALAAVTADRRDRPVSPLRISSMNLVDANQGGVRRLETTVGRSGAPVGTTTKPSASQPDRPEPRPSGRAD
jgi:peptidyl-prolyl cis-trans isomerase B (cyclophilin B)